MPEYLGTDVCRHCESNRLASVGAKCSDCCYFSTGDLEYDGYAPSHVGVGGGDYIDFVYCLDCGTIQSDEFPVPNEVIEHMKEKAR